MECIQLSLSGALLFQLDVWRDERGFFCERYRKSFLESQGVLIDFPQQNHSYSVEGTLRGMHFQAFPGQAKLVSAIAGTIYDVFVDIRKDSPTFGKWDAVVLDFQKTLFLPVGFAHGFYVLSKEAHVVYEVSTPYNPAQEKGFCYNDPTLQILWPSDPKVISEKDRTAPAFAEVFL